MKQRVRRHQKGLLESESEVAEKIDDSLLPAQHSVSPSSFEPDMSGAGSRLPEVIREQLETQLQSDFGHVRVYDDPITSQSADSIQARAFTIGSNIGFARGEYRPHTLEGRKLLAHELVHVVQQDARPGGRGRVLGVATEASGLESEAKHVSEQVASERTTEPNPVTVTERVGQPIVQRATRTAVDTSGSIPDEDELHYPSGAELLEQLRGLAQFEAPFVNEGEVTRDRVGSGPMGPSQFGPPGREHGPWRVSERSEWALSIAPEETPFYKISTPYGDYWYPYFLDDVVEPNAHEALELHQQIETARPKLQPLLESLGLSKEFGDRLADIDISADIAGNATADTVLHARSFAVSLDMSARIQYLEETLRSDYADRIASANRAVAASNRALDRIEKSGAAKGLRDRGENLQERLDAEMKFIDFTLDAIAAGKDPIAWAKIGTEVLSHFDPRSHYADFLLNQAKQLEADVRAMEFAEASHQLQDAISELESAKKLQDRMSSQSGEIVTEVEETRSLIEYRFDQESEGEFDFGRLEVGISLANDVIDVSEQLLRLAPLLISVSSRLRLEPYVRRSRVQDSEDVSHLLDVEGNRKVSSGLMNEASVCVAETIAAHAYGWSVRTSLSELRDEGFNALRGLTRQDLERRSSQ
jgi:hypothetical protein